MELKIDAEQLKQIASEAIMRSLDASAKEAMIAQAIKHLLTQGEGQYGRKTDSPLQLAFNMALQGVVHEVCREKIKSDPTIAARVEDLVTKGWKKAIFESEDQLVSQIACSIRDWLVRDRS